MRRWRTLRPSKRRPYWRLQYGFWAQSVTRQKFVVLAEERFDTQEQAEQALVEKENQR